MAHINLTREEEAIVLEGLQDYLQDGIVMVIGSGFPAGYGLPGTQALATHLQSSIPANIESFQDSSAWTMVVERLTAGDGLEAALQATNVSDHLLQAITRESSTFIEVTECDALKAIGSDLTIPSLGRLAQHILRASRKLHIVTPNYDRLIEYQIELAGISVDTGYIGAYAAHYDPERTCLLNKEYIPEGRKGTIRTIVYPHVQIHKPHGSLDWYVQNDRILRSSVPLDLPRAIITPGLTKYRDGYLNHYSQQHSSAKKALEKAQRILAVGYGFNDDQLEQSWCPALSTSKPILILTKLLSDNARRLLHSSTLVSALTENTDDGGGTSLYQVGAGDPKVFSRPIWNMTSFVQEVIR